MITLKELREAVATMPISQPVRVLALNRHLTAIDRKLQEIRKGRAYRSQRKLLRKERDKLTAELAMLIMSKD